MARADPLVIDNILVNVEQLEKIEIVKWSMHSILTL